MHATFRSSFVAPLLAFGLAGAGLTQPARLDPGPVALATSGPTFEPPSPCGQSLKVSVGIPFTYTIVASSNSALPGNAVTLDVVGAPPGSFHTPTLPLMATGATATVTTVFSWTPGVGQFGPHTLVYTATDQLGQVATCTVDLLTAECYLLLGFTEIAYPLGPDGDDMLLVLPVVSYLVSTTSIPGLVIPNDPSLLNLTVAAQIGMLNPAEYPGNALQMSNGLRLTIGGGTQSYGLVSGIDLHTGQLPSLGTTLHFAFTVQ